ncbi:S8 family serine peptidase, partial [Candidatus Uhrbacteria bacterium]|nr:S8 family serine peptidase [Candidatus Uhrbacteria bacterium]
LVFLLAPASVFALVPNDAFFGRQWYLEKIGAPAAWDVTTGNPKSIVAVIDVGVDIAHPDLKEAIWTNPGEVAGNGVDDDRNGFVDDVHGWDFVAGTNDPTPKYDVSGSETRDLHHGTLVAGIIAARGNNLEGIAGIDWRAKILPLRVLHSDGSGEVDAVLSAFQYAIRAGATVINLSFIGQDRSTDLDAAIADAVAKGVVVVAAGGNEDRTGKGDLDRFPVYPICAGLDGASVVGVAATNDRDEKAVFSSYGRCVDIAAPGERILGTLFYDPNQVIVKIGGTVTATTFAQPYGGFFSGTSFAAPVAAGAISLLRGVLPNATPADLLGLLQRTADPIQNGTHVTTGRVGAGRLNLARAVGEAAAQAAAVPSVTATTVTVSAPLAALSDAVAVRVEVRSDRGNPLIGRAIELRSSRLSDAVSPTRAMTDGNGSAVFSVRASDEGISEFSVVVDGAVVGNARTVFARALAQPIGSGSLLRGTASTVYVISRDGKRYAFPDAQAFRSWVPDANGVARVSDSILAAFPLGGLVTMRPGTFLVKIQTDPKVYAVESGGTLRGIPDEAMARTLYGDQWAARVVDVPDAFFATYRTGLPLAGIHPSGTLLEDVRDGTRYLIVNGLRRRIDSTLAFLKNGFQWRDVVRVPAVTYPDGPALVDRELGLAQPVS